MSPVSASITGTVGAGFRLLARGLSALRFFLGLSATVMTGRLGSSGDLCLSRTGLWVVVSFFTGQTACLCVFKARRQTYKVGRHFVHHDAWDLSESLESFGSRSAGMSFLVWHSHQTILGSVNSVEGLQVTHVYATFDRKYSSVRLLTMTVDSTDCPSRVAVIIRASREEVATAVYPGEI